MQRTGMLILAMAAAFAVAAIPVAAQHGAANGEWRSHGGDIGGTKYSPLDQITADNFSDLEVAWHWRTVDTHLARAAGRGTSLVPADTLFDLLEAEEPDR